MKYSVLSFIFMTTHSMAMTSIHSDRGSLNSGYSKPLVSRPYLARSKDYSQTNHSFLSNQKYTWNEASLNELLLDRQMSVSLKRDYEDQNREYEMKEKYSLVDRDQQIKHLASMNRFSENILNQIRDRQKEIHFNMLKDFAKRDKNLRKLKRPGAVLGIMYGLYKGEEFELPMGSEMRVRAYTKATEKRGGFKLLNPILNTGMDFASMSPNKRDAFEPQDAQNTRPRGERYQVHVWRLIPGLGVTSSLAYGFSTDTANAAMSRPIVANLTAQVDASRVMHTAYQTAPQNEGRLSLNYGIAF